MNTRAQIEAWPLGLRRENAARFFGVSPSKFDEFVKAGIIPAPRLAGAIKLWDRRELESVFDDLPREGEAMGNSWDNVA